MRRILQFVADGNPGGGSTVVLGLVEDLMRDHDVHILVERGSYVAERARALGATVHEGAFFGSILSKEPVQRVREVVQAVKPELIHFHGNRALFFGRGLRHSKATYTVHGYHFLHRGFKDRMLGGFAERVAIREVQEIVYVCDYDRKLGQKAGLIPAGMKTRVIYNGVEVPEIPADGRDEKQIAFLNRLVYQKDPLLAIEAMRHLTGFRLVLIGGGEMESEVRAAAAGLGDAVDFRGAVPREEALRLVAESGAMLMTSRWEGLPLAPLEAMALGVPVVAPAVSGIPEIVDSGVNGLLVDSRSAEDFANAMRQVCTPGAERVAMIEAAREKVERVFSWRTCLAGYRALYESL